MSWAIVHKSKQAVTIGLISSLLFCGSISFRQIENSKRHEITFFSLRKNNALAYNNHGSAIVVTDINSADKTWSYSINPTISITGASIQKTTATSSNFKATNYFLSSNYLQLSGYKILRWDRSFNKTNFASVLEVDAVLISGNPWVKLEELSKTIHFKTLLIDASNPEYKIKLWETEAQKMHLDLHVLKKKPAYIVKL